MLCPKCHTNNPDGEKYCKNCGFQLNASRICPECGAHNRHDTKFCSECGAGLSPVGSFRRDVVANQDGSFFSKYKALIIAAIILVLAIGAVTGIALYNNSSSNTGGSDDGFSFFPLINDTNQNDQLDDMNDTNQSVNETNKTVNATDKNKTADKDNSTDKNKNSTKNKTADSNNTKNDNKSVESVDNHSKVITSDDDKDKSSKAVIPVSKDKSSKDSSQASKDKSSKGSSQASKSDSSSSSDEGSSHNVIPDSSTNHSTDNTAEDDGAGENVSDDANQSENESNEINMSDVPELAKEVESAGYDFSTIEFDGNEFSQSQCIAIFAKYISGSTSGSMEIPEVSSASSPSGDDLSQSVSKKDYMSIADDVDSYVSSNGQIPDNAVISGDEESDISPNKILELFTKVITDDFPESVDI